MSSRGDTETSAIATSLRSASGCGSYRTVGICSVFEVRNRVPVVFSTHAAR
jgi:PII-like signaling protein